MNRLSKHSTKLMFAAVGLFLLANASGEEPRNRLEKKKHRVSDAPFLTPAEAVAEMAIPDGFDVSVFAAEPDIAEPIAFCFDHRGRLWVAENFNYRTRREHTDDPVSRIQILEDVDGDGVFDKKKTFTDKLTFTSGLAVGFGGVFVGSPPNLTFIPDADGDDKPDGPPQVLLDGWEMQDRHETLNSFIWGPDGWLYGCHGVFTQSNVGKPGDGAEARQFIDGGIWRYHPTQHTFEVFARGLSNPWGFDFDDHGQGFATCCVIPHLFHVVQGGVYHKQSRPHVNPYIYDDIKTIRDHTHLSAHGGARFYLADTFGPKYRDRLFMCNIHEHAVLTDVMVPKGSSFIGQHGDDFMPTNDMAWVGFSVEVGPEGGLYLLDWHDNDVCGNAINFPNSGRVYRLMPKNAEPFRCPDLNQLSDLELVELQTHRNDWFVRHARTLLQSRAASGTLNRGPVAAALNKLFSEAEASPLRLRALWAMHCCGVIDAEDLAAFLTHSDDHVRAWAVQLLTDESSINAFQPNRAQRGSEYASNIDVTAIRKFAQMAEVDPSPTVRLQLAAAAQRLSFDDRWPILRGLASRAEDNADNNLPRMIWFALEPMVPRFKTQAIDLAIQGRMPLLQSHVARRVASEAIAERAIAGQASNLRPKPQPAEWQWKLQKIAPGFQVRNVGEGGVVLHDELRNRIAIQTHPSDRKTPAELFRYVTIPAGKSTTLQICVSHHPHGDWQLRVTVDGVAVKKQVVASKTVSADEWLEVEIELTEYAGDAIRLGLENVPTGWNNEWAYWNRVELVSQ